MQKVAEKELDRLSKMSTMSAEYTVARTYLDWLTEVSWSHRHRGQPEHKGCEQDP